MTPRKKDCKQALNSPQKKKWRTRSLKLYRGLAGDAYRRVLFSDEKNFYLDQPLNRQNDRVYIRKGQKKPLNTKTVVEKRKFPPKIMVWAGIAHNLKTTLFFIEKGSTLNANKNKYKNNILRDIVVPFCRKNKLMYQQDGAPCHTAKICSDYLKSENIEFWDKNDWPPNSPDLNPLDYGIWGILDAEVYRKPPKSLEALKRRIQQTWDQLQITIVNNCIDSFKKRLRKCVEMLKELILNKM